MDSDDNISADSLSLWNKVFALTRIVVIFFMFAIVLGTGVISKFTFLVMTANIFPPHADYYTSMKTANFTLTYNRTDKTNVLWVWALILSMSAPYFFTCLRSFWRLCFKKTHPVKLSTVLVVSTIPGKSVYFKHCFIADQISRYSY